MCSDHLLVSARLDTLSDAERGVLEDVCHARGILRHGAQRDEEDVLGVVRGDVQVLRPRAIVEQS